MIDEHSLVSYLRQSFPDKDSVILERVTTEESSPYGIVGGIWWDLLEPALQNRDKTMARRCFGVVEDLLQTGTDLIAGAVRFRITPFLIPWEAQCGDLIGPLLKEDIHAARGG